MFGVRQEKVFTVGKMKKKAANDRTPKIFHTHRRYVYTYIYTFYSSWPLHTTNIIKVMIIIRIISGFDRRRQDKVHMLGLKSHKSEEA